MIQMLYTGSYSDHEDEGGLPIILENAVTHGTATERLERHPEARYPNYAVHAIIYAMSDKYNLRGLKFIPAFKFATTINKKEFTAEQLGEAIGIVYSTTPDCDNGLRKWVVYRAQRAGRLVEDYEGFQDLVKTNGEFAWDYATKYARQNQVWCPDCKQYTDLVDCECGFSGLCGDEICNEQDWGRLECCKCQIAGRLQREEPKEDQELEAFDRDKASASWIRKSPRSRKKRRFS